MLLLLGVWAHHGWPPGSNSGLWFYSAALAVLLSVFLSEPFYTSPKAALANSAALLILATTVSPDGFQASRRAITVGRVSLVVFAIGVFFVSAVAILTLGRFDRVNRIAFRLSVTFGAGYVLYGLAYIGAVYATFAHDPSKLAVLLVAPWLLVSGVPDRLFHLVKGMTPPISRPQKATIYRTEDPSAAVLHLHKQPIVLGQKVRTSSGATGLIVDLTETTDPRRARAVFPRGTVLRSGNTLDILPLDGRSTATIVGYTDVGTTINSLRVGAASAVSTTDIEEGRLLSVPIRDQEVLFQVTGAMVRDESIGGEDHCRYQLSAQKLGKWNEETAAFDLVPWLPEPNAPVELKTRAHAHFNPEGIGIVPGSRYAIRLYPEKAVTYNTAILGILGSGKTTLAKELVCRTVYASIKVIILDITGQYEDYFDTLAPKADAVQRINNIKNQLSGWHNQTKQDHERYWGSSGEFSRLISADIKAFLKGSEPLRIYNPEAFTATTKEGFASSSGSANVIRELSTPEKTAVIAQALLEATRENGETSTGRVCLVIEEAHSLTPEPYDGLNADDKHAVNRTARAVLQGRKYGYGCILITQRTANVTKTILNQCHTVFALRSYDSTGMTFLSNYLGDDYTRLLTSMPKFHCVAFGEGVSAAAPILIRLNNGDDFTKLCWVPFIDQRASSVEPVVAAGVESDLDDDIPF